MRLTYAAAAALMVFTVAGAAVHAQTKTSKPVKTAVAARIPAAPQVAIAVIEPTQGNSCHGIVRFTATGTGLRVVADLQGLTPGATHGFHIHEFGDCSAPDAASAGGHYNPGAHAHALPPTMPRHAGDLGNVRADSTGAAHYEITVRDVSIDGRHPILGHAVIVHAKPDDGSQPTGNAGGRIGCGVIGYAQGSRGR